MSRRLVLVALLVFPLVLLLAPISPVATEYMTLNIDSTGNPRRWVRDALDDGWVVRRADDVTGVGPLITFERPRVVGLWRAAGDVFNDLAGR